MIHLKTKNILEANICAFGQTIFDIFSLENDEFVRNLDYYINNNNFEEMIEEYAYEFDYDIDDIQNIVNNSKYKEKEWEYMDIITSCRLAYIKTIEQDKTIGVYRNIY